MLTVISGTLICVKEERRLSLTSRRIFDTLKLRWFAIFSISPITNNTLQFVERRTYAGFEGSDFDCS
jgi:hypothetical protein